MGRMVLLVAALTLALPPSVFGQSGQSPKSSPEEGAPDGGAIGACLGTLVGSSRQPGGSGGLIGAAVGGLVGAEKPCSGGTACCVPASGGEAPKTNAKLVAELVGILNDTESPDTFLLTLSCLEALEVEPGAVLPALLRNAERLGITKGIVNRIDNSTKPANGEAEAVAKQQEMLLHSLEHFLKTGEEARQKKETGGKGVVPPPCAYGDSTPVHSCPPRPCYYDATAVAKDCPAPVVPRAHSARVRELLTTINRTRSTDAFLKAVESLTSLRTDPDTDAAAPAVLRNADRLGLLKGMFQYEGRTEMQERLGECLYQLMKRPVHLSSADFD